MSDVTHPIAGHDLCLDLGVLKSEDARDLLRLIYRRVVAGESHYGRLDLLNDPRDFTQERLEENVDAAVYEAMDVLRRSRRRVDARRALRERVDAIERERSALPVLDDPATVITLTETE